MNRAELKRTLEGLGMRPSKSMGQNYLCDPNLARWIAHQARLQPGEHLLEIGPGLGALTDHLLPEGGERPGGATLVEFDRIAAEFIAKKFGAQAGVEVRQMDAMKLHYPEFFPKGPVVLVSNLPYKGGGNILMQAADWPTPVARMVVMLQMEVAERLTAAPDHGDYGALTVHLGLHWKVRMLKKVSPQVFWPEPAVESAVVGLEPRAYGEMPFCRERFFHEMVKVGFAQRRKQLTKLLRTWRPETDWAALLAQLGLDRQSRAENLSVKSFARLAALAAPLPGQEGAAQDVEAEIFDVVDAQDAVTSQQPRGLVHAQGLWHRAVHVFLVDGNGNVFLQRRSPLKDKFPNVWDSSAAGHLEAGEDYEPCAVRELEEELGISGLPLERIGKISACEATGWEFVELYAARVEKKKQVDPVWPPAEIESAAWFSAAEIRAWTAARPQDFASGFLECWKLWGQFAKETV